MKGKSGDCCSRMGVNNEDHRDLADINGIWSVENPLVKSSLILGWEV